MDKIRLLLRSVYLKGHQDGNLKKADMSWEDKIIKDIDALYKEFYLAMLPEENFPPLGSLEDKYGYLAGQRKGFNSAIQEMREKIG